MADDDKSNEKEEKAEEKAEYDRHLRAIEENDTWRETLMRRYMGGNFRMLRGECYLTTACTVAAGLPDDCDELTLLRDLRDNYLVGLPNGRKLMAEYESMAPKVVKAINALPNAKEIWMDVYEQVTVACGLVREGNLEGAVRYYESMSRNLKELYLL